MVKIVLSETATGGVLYKKVFLKFKKFTGKHMARIFFNKFAGTADVSTYHLNLKIFEHTYRKLMNFFKVLPKENLKSACKR